MYIHTEFTLPLTALRPMCRQTCRNVNATWYEQCASVPVPDEDASTAAGNVRGCEIMKRAVTVCNESPRIFMNENTHWIDGSQVESGMGMPTFADFEI